MAYAGSLGKREIPTLYPESILTEHFPSLSSTLTWLGLRESQGIQQQVAVLLINPRDTSGLKCPSHAQLKSFPSDLAPSFWKPGPLSSAPVARGESESRERQVR